MTKEQVEALRALADLYEAETKRIPMNPAVRSKYEAYFTYPGGPAKVRALCDLALEAIGASSAEGDSGLTQAQATTLIGLVPAYCWLERSFTGVKRLMIQHEGEAPFCYVSIDYDYRYTDNASQAALAEHIARHLGFPVEWRAEKFPGTSAPAVGARKEGAELGADEPVARHSRGDI